MKILLIDNQRLGMVRQWQELFYDKRYSHTDLSDNPDFAAIATGYRIAAERVDDLGELRDAFERFLKVDGPALLHCACFAGENVWPLIPPGATVNDAMNGSAPEPQPEPAIA